MQIFKTTKLVSKISSSAFLLLFTVFIMASCSQNKSKDSEQAEGDSLTSQQSQQSTQQALQSLGGDSAINIEVSDKELEKFSSVVQKMQMMQRDMNKDMIAAIEKEGMEVKEFNRIMKQQQAPKGQGNDSVEISEESMEKFNNASKELQSIQAGSQQKFMKALEDEGMDFKRYRQIAMALRQDQELMQRFQSMNSSPANQSQGNPAPSE